MILTIAMWTWSAHFSKRSPCNHEIRFIFLFGVDLPALGAGRTVALVFASLMMTVYTGVTLAECVAWRRNRMSRLSIRDAGREVDVEMTPGGTYTTSGRHQHKNSITFRSRRRHQSRQQWLGIDVDRMSFNQSSFASLTTRCSNFPRNSFDPTHHLGLLRRYHREDRSSKARRCLRSGVHFVASSY
jgi:hypothetical protein